VTQVPNQRCPGAPPSRSHRVWRPGSRRAPGSQLAASLPQSTSLSQPTSLPLAALLSLLTLAPACYGGDFFDRLVDPDATAAFRIIQLTLVDPHTYSGDTLECRDSTANYNSFFADNIVQFDTNTTLVLRPLDPAIDRDTVLEIVPAVCVPGDTIVNCTDKDVPPASIITAGFNNIEGGTCLTPVAGSLNPLYMGGTGEQLHAPRSPCLVTALIPSLNLALAPTLQLPLSNVQIAAAYQLDGPSQRLVQGVIRGFLPSNLAMTVIGDLKGMPFTPWVLFAGGGACYSDTSDIDTVTVPSDGVWMYFNFTAERVAWTSEASMDTGGSSSSSSTSSTSSPVESTTSAESSSSSSTSSTSSTSTASTAL
jgi:hypothetical protein